MSIPNVRKRIAFLIAAVLSYVFFAGFPTNHGFVVSRRRAYGFGVGRHRDTGLCRHDSGLRALARVAPSLVPPYLTKKAVAAIMYGIVIITTVYGGVYMLKPYEI